MGERGFRHLRPDRDERDDLVGKEVGEMTNAESAKAATEARDELKAEPTAKTTHGDPLARYLGAVAYKEKQEKKTDHK
ncbi:hypothetical protein BCF44_119111 [Kutzneria buriramensis]|uniref:Uncharacterized protein n=1 Tax=Kutzneria buriramensis TaxID=1045776 RepID=A0A3E0GYK2_9PSEU|nr:hypothetical protein BCF44_119111 [Kutzneria buriramensis]